MVTIYEVLGACFHNHEGAYEMAQENITQDDIIEHLAEFFDFHDLAAWCLNNPDFYEHFEDEVCEAQDRAIEDIIIERTFDDNDDNLEYLEFFDEEE